MTQASVRICRSSDGAQQHISFNLWWSIPYGPLNSTWGWKDHIAVELCEPSFSLADRMPSLARSRGCEVRLAFSAKKVLIAERCRALPPSQLRF